jgi:hypothetical protein
MGKAQRAHRLGNPQMGTLRFAHPDLCHVFLLRRLLNRLYINPNVAIIKPITGFPFRDGFFNVAGYSVGS